MAVGVIKVDMNISTFNKGFNTDYSNMGGEGIALYSAEHKKPSIFSKWFWKGLYGSIFGFKFSEGAVEPAEKLLLKDKFVPSTQKGVVSVYAAKVKL